MRVLFWGTPGFATPPLRALIGEGFDVVGVVTQPDRPRGRSRSILVPSPVKEIALEEGIPVLQPERPRGQEFMSQIAGLEPELSVVVAYGHILPHEVIDLPSGGTLNIHASLLPALRGAGPIQAAIRQGHAETGVTIMRMVPALDAGPVLLRMPTPILENESYGELQQRMAEMGALALMEALALLSIGAIVEEEQDEALATYAPKVQREDALVDWRQSADEVARTIRAYDPKPGAFTTVRGSTLKLYGGRPETGHSGAAGEVLAVDEDGLLVACGSDAVRIAFVHPDGRRRLSAHEWLQGRGAAIGERLG